MRKTNKKFSEPPIEILDCISEIIMDDLDQPCPMRNHKPAKKTKTGSEKFWDSHQAQYEMRARCSGGRVARARRHNAAYPKLIDELYKRRSIAKITTSQSKKPSTRYKTSKTSRNTSRRKSKRGPSRIAKMGADFKTIASQCAYVLVKNKRVGGEAGLLKIDSKVNIDISIRAKPPKTASSGGSQPESRSGLSLRKPNTSIATLSTYNSYESLEQEPML